MNVVILGCGPAGLIAAQGALDAGADDITIISRARKSDLFGAQYLHEPIPGIDCGEPVQVSYSLQGDPMDYRLKVYGDLWDGTVSPEDLQESHEAWDIRAAYDRLWDKFGNAVYDVNLSPGFIINLDQSAELIISSVPRPLTCIMGHAFQSTMIYAAGDAPRLGIKVPYTCSRNSVICNGYREVSWYRLSNIFDHTTVEWPGSLKMPPPVATAGEVIKPLRTNCDCLPNIVHVGRYGRWEKGVLSHQSYSDAFGAVERAKAGLSA